MVGSSVNVLGATTNADDVALFEARFAVSDNCRVLLLGQDQSFYLASRLIPLGHYIHQCGDCHFTLVGDFSPSV